MSYPADDIRRLLSTASNAVEEAAGLLGERPALGDGGVAEAIVGAENALTLAVGRFDVHLDRTPELR